MSTPRPLTRRLTGDAAEPGWTLLTWNTLADGLAYGSFIATPEDSLAWASRGPRILAELAAGLAELPDVICLQEVDHHAELEAYLAAEGFVGAHAPKAEGRDGCSLFVRAARFALDEVETVRYRDPETGAPLTQLALFATLTPTDGGAPVRVATTHLKAKRGHEALRGEQARQLVAAASASPHPVVIAGDFNDTPGSPAHAAMVEGGYASAYAELLAGEAPWTTWKLREAGEKKCTIDYVWCGPGLRPRACLAIPPDAEVEATRLPSWQYPSDHLSLAVRLAPATA